MSDLTLSVSSSTNVLTSAVGADQVNLTLSESTNVVTKVVSPENTLSIDLTGSVTPTTIGNLTDVKVSGITNGQVLAFNSSSSKFEPADSVSNSPASFTTISVAGQDNIVADKTFDLLTIDAGSNVTVTTNASTDTITIASSDTNTQLSTEEVQDIVGAMFSGNTETRISATYEDSDGTIDLTLL